MIAIITGDIIDSKNLKDQNNWLVPIKTLFSQWGKTPKHWEIYRGDSFQVELAKAEEALNAAIQIKAIIKNVSSKKASKRTSPIDVRMAIGIGEKEFDANRVSESNGEAFINSGEKFETLKKTKQSLAIQSPWAKFDKDFNLYLKLANIEMDSWSISSGELISAVLKYPKKTQLEIGQLLGIEQNSVSGRYKRTHIEEILELDKMYREKLTELIDK
jgi:hypothetical protein